MKRPVPCIFKDVTPFIAYHYFYFIILKTEINIYYFDTLNCFAYFTCCPFIPTCSYTSILIAPSMMAAGDERCGKANK
jgi:hypothetical protein